MATLNGIEWYCGPLSGVSSGIDSLSGVSSGIELLFLGFEVVFRDSCRDRPEWYFWDFLMVFPEWYCGPPKRY